MPEKKTKPDPKDPASLLAFACERNIPLEIHKHTGDGAVPVVRARMMCTDSERLYLDEPQTIGKEVQMDKNTSVDVYFSIGDALYSFTTTIASMNCKVRLNELKMLFGMALNLPESVTQGQRRSRFRTSLALQTPITVTMHQASADLNSAPVNAERFEGWLVDASDGGLGVKLDFDCLRMFKMYDRWIVRFMIPGQTEMMTLGCELRQTRTIHEGETMKIGLLALPWPTKREMREQMLPLTRYLNGVGRQIRKRAS